MTTALMSDTRYLTDHLVGHRYGGDPRSTATTHSGTVIDLRKIGSVAPRTPLRQLSSASRASFPTGMARTVRRRPPLR